MRIPILIPAVVITLTHWLSAASLEVKNGAKIAFLGDSITQGGAASSGGYVRLVESGFKANGITIEVIPAGISGHKSNDMLARLERDVLSKKPDWMTLSCGVNDVWHHERGVPLDQYQLNITEIINRTQAAGVKVLILTATPIKENQNDDNKKLVDYNAFLLQVAKDKKCPVVDLNSMFWAELREPHLPKPPGNYLTNDGVHMNPLGNELMAVGVLKGFNFNDTQIHKALQAWGSTTTEVRGAAPITLNEYKALNAIGGTQGKDINRVLSEALATGIRELTAKGSTLAPPSASEPGKAAKK